MDKHGHLLLVNGLENTFPCGDLPRVKSDRKATEHSSRKEGTLAVLVIVALDIDNRDMIVVRERPARN
jgi:hypothetical protein